MELLTPYEVRSAGQTFARLADIGHALQIMRLMLNDSPSKVHLCVDGWIIYTAWLLDLQTDQDLEEARLFILDTLDEMRKVGELA